MSSQKEDSNMSAEQMAQVDDYLEQFMVRDEDGVLVNVKCSHSELQNLLNRYHPPTLQDFLPLDSALNTGSFRKAVLERYRSQLTISMRLGSDKRYKERKNQLSPIDQLKQLALDWGQHPSEAVVVAKMYLYGWFGTPQDADYARYLLERVEDVCGEPSAAALLAKVRIPSEPVTPFDNRGARQGAFLIDSRIFRDRFHRKAREASPAYRRWEEDNNELAADSYHAELNTEMLPDAKERLKHAEHLAQSGESDHMYWAGEAALSLLDMLEQVCDRDSDTLKVYWEKARDWFFKAQSLDARARTVISERFEHDDEKAFDLLVSAVFPEDGVEWDPNALSPLARRFYLNAESTHFNAEVGERCLHLYQDAFPIVEFDSHVPTVSGDVETVVFFADYLRKKSKSDAADLLVAFKLYQASASDSAYAALRAGLMLLRGEGCEGSAEEAKRFLEFTKNPQRSRRDSKAAKYAETVLLIGWENLAYVREAALDLVLLADEFEFSGDPDCPLTHNDIDLLIAQNPFRQEHVSLMGDDWLEKWVICNDQIRCFVKVLQPELPLNVSEFASLCQNHDPLALFALGQVWRTGRFGDYDFARSQQFLQGAIDGLQKRLTTEKEHLTKNLLSRLLQRAQLCFAETLREKHHLDLAEARAKAEMEKLVVEANAAAKEKGRMLSALSHTLHNSLVSGPEIIRTAVRVLGARQESLSPTEHKVLNDLTSLHSTFELNENLIQSFKLLVSAPEKLLSEVMAEQDGLPTIGEVVADSLRRNLASVLFHGNDTRRAYHLIGNRDYATLVKLRAEYRYQLLSAEELLESPALVSWVLDKLPGLQLSLGRESFMHPLHNSIQHALVFVIVSELLANALKHADDKQAIRIDLTFDGVATELRVQTGLAGTLCLSDFRNSTGGMSFIDRLVDGLTVPGVFDASLDQEASDGIFFSRLVLRDERLKQDEHRLD
jgi:TPR repeat protein/signal transduction histidine kinase